MSVTGNFEFAPCEVCAAAGPCIEHAVENAYRRERRWLRAVRQRLHEQRAEIQRARYIQPRDRRALGAEENK
jgi:hypothetical protein